MCFNMSLAPYNHLFNLLIIITKGLSQLIKTQQVVIVTLGGDAHFSCRLMEPRDVLQVTWQKETPGGTENVASYNKRFGPKVNPPFNRKVEFLNVGLQSCSIVIRGVSREDESCYKCLFNIYPDGSIIGRTCLQTIELYGPTLIVTRTTDTHPLFSGLTVSCSATGRPAPIVTWDETIKLVLENSTTVNVTHPNGTVTVTITSIVEVPSLPDIDTMVRCVVSSGSAIKEGSRRIPTSFTGPTVPPVSNDGWIRGHGTVGLVVVIALVCSIVWWLHKRNPKNREERKQQEDAENRDSRKDTFM
ncbi:OX-2 membrane glycoprotein-like [Esox lucius]|uniref:Ig-like domain-containing protein n=1 Tax=Esox lucius TaxID=8010 RepID=A0A6Q2YBE8_ESOLU|nr:OX-2 membrane glycoprotein-like [Esox lucius]XP_019900744.3 OX-2 membrane glycoprotein-like [Esox lucius]